MPVKESTSRSDQVRQRRGSRPRKPVSSGSSRRSTRSVNSTLPKVTVRSGGLHSAFQSEQKGKKVKRRYDVALNTEGAEIRLPSLPRFAIGWRLLSGVLVIILGFIVYNAMYSPYFQVADIQAEGLRRLTSQDLNAVSDIRMKSILFVDPEAVQMELLAAFPDLESVKVEVGLPANVTIKAVERRPVLSWEKEGEVLWVDSTGVAFPPRGDNGPQVKVVAPNLPTQTQGDKENSAGITVTELLPVDLVEAVLAMAEQAPENTPIVYDDQHGLGWHDEFGWVVFFGKDTDDMDQKLKVYRVLAKRLKKENPRPELISVEYLHAPYYRLER